MLAPEETAGKEELRRAGRRPLRARVTGDPPHATGALGALPVGKYDSVDGADVLVWNDLHLSLASGGRTLTSWSRQTMR